MGKTLDLGRRLELHSMDKHCQDISLGLYRRNLGGVPHVLVHTYSSVSGASQRVAFIKQALIVMLEMEESDGSPDWLRFRCRTMHERSLKRGFLDLCKLPTDAPLEPKPLTSFDKKANGHLRAQSLGAGLYETDCQEPSEAGRKRATALARGFAKICEMDPIEGQIFQVVFPCRTSHDALMGMLMFRAQNVRAAMQEDEMATSRGVLSAPSQGNE